LVGESVRVFGRVELVAEGREAAEADVEDDAEGPDVNGTSVAAVVGGFEDFRGDVGGSAATESISGVKVSRERGWSGLE
jgi:hypothetical protein